MAFEIFTPATVSRRGTGEPAITITKSGNISRNSATVRTYVKDKSFVLFMYDAESRRIGLKLLDEQAEHAYRISKPKSGGAQLAARRFLEHFEIDYKESRRLPVELDTESQTLIAQLG